MIRLHRTRLICTSNLIEFLPSEQSIEKSIILEVFKKNQKRNFFSDEK